MPYEKIEDIPPQFRALASQPGGKDKIDLTLEQANELARMFDGLKGTEGIDSPAAIAITNFRRMYKVEGGKWVKRSENEKMAEFDEIDKFAATEEAKAEQEKRASRYGIAIKSGGNVTKPSEYESVPDEKFGDPVNYRYPLNQERVLPAMRYFNHEGQREAGGYSTEEWNVIGKRIAEAVSSYMGADYKCEGGKIMKKEEMAEVFELKDFPFFKTGTHNGKSYSESDLDRLVTNFYSLKNIVQPVLKLGHGGQKFLKNEGLPAIGWIESIKKMGQILYADIKNIPKRIYELLKNKAYRRPSAEIYEDYQVELYGNFKDEKGQQYGLTLSAIALLGADIPAIKSLPDIEALFNNDAFTSIITCYNENYDRNKGGLIMADEQAGLSPQITTQTQTTEQQIATLQTELKAKADQVAKLEAEAAQIKETQRNEGIKATIAKYKESGKVLPVQESALSTLLLSFDDVKVFTYSDNGTSQTLKQAELLFKVLDALPNIVQFTELSQQRGMQDTKGKEAQYRDLFMSESEKTLALDGIDVAELADKIMAERKISYTEALVVASEQLEK